MNRFVSSVMRSTNVSLNTSVQHGFPWNLLSVVAETPPIDYLLLSIRRSKSPRFERLREHFKNPMLEAYLLFYQFSLKVFVKLNLLLQREDPLISRVHGHFQRFLKKLALKFLNLDVIDQNDNPLQIGFEDTNNQKSGNVIKGVLCGLILRFLYSVDLIR